MFIAPPACAENQEPVQSSRKAENLKAIFILNFTQFVEWPSENWIADDEPLVITVLQDKSLASILRKVVKGESKDNHPIIVKEINDLTELQSSHILFVGENYWNEATKVFSHTNGKGLLTVSDAVDFTENGGVIGFYLDDGKMRIQINRTAASYNRLKVSSKLLSVARIIETDSN